MSVSRASAMSSIYEVCGLGLESSIEFPELATGARTVDVRLRLERLDAARPPHVHDEDWFEARQREDAWFHWRAIGSVRATGGREVAVDPAPEADPAEVRAALLGPVLSVVLAQRGLLPLHASLVGVHGSACAFVAAQGAGKSTLAAALVGRGHEFLSDDVAALQPALDPVRAYPGFARIRLMPEVVARLGHVPERLEPIYRGHAKLSLPVDARLPFEGVPLARIYVLEQGRVERIEPALPHAALIAVVDQVRVPRMLHAVLSTHGLMSACAAVVERVPVFRLRRPRDLARLEQLAELVEEHVSRPAADPRFSTA